MGELRIKQINTYRHFKPNQTNSQAKPKLLDIGCAYGFFLDVVLTYGYDTYGIDISSHAEAEIAPKHAFQCGNFLTQDLKFDTSLFEVVSMWYVIEHFDELSPVIKRVSELLKLGGIFAFSTPNGDGLSARFNSEVFFKTSPKDHYYIFTLAGITAFCNKYGYELLGFRATGIHYERFKNSSRPYPSTFPNHGMSGGRKNTTWEILWKCILGKQTNNF